MTANKRSYGPKWSMEDILTYLDEEAEWNDRPSFSSQLKEDAFLQDVCDGFAGHTPLYIRHHLDQLHDKFKAGEQGRRIARWPAVAAVILSIAAATWLFIREEGPERFSWRQNEQAEPLPSTAERMPADGATLSETLALEDDSLRYDALAINEEETPGTLLSQQEEAISSGTFQSPPAASAPERSARSFVISGQVIDADGEPLQGAHVFFPNNRTGITTGLDGHFMVRLQRKDEKVNVTHPAFEPADFELQGRNNNRLQMIEGLAIAVEPDQLDRVSIPELSGLSTERAKEDEGSQSTSPTTTGSDDKADNIEESMLGSKLGYRTVDATPVEGYKKYDRYVKRNLELPTAAELAEVSGRVIVQFKVMPNGELFDFQIIQSLGYGCDEEALRLLREGPAWSPVEETIVGQTTYTFMFEK